jgi:Mlc titration factor MtfA (ptsG expression regulator)
MAVSKTQFGSGHSYPYMRDYDGGRSKMEWFAHSFENYFQGNPIFQSEFPELYEIMNDYVYEEIVLPYTPKDLLN